VVHTVVIKSVFERAPETRAQKDRQTEAAVLGSLGNAYLMGEYNQAIAYLQASLKVANEINNPGYRSSTLNSLGNAYISLG